MLSSNEEFGEINGEKYPLRWQLHDIGSTSHSPLEILYRNIGSILLHSLQNKSLSLRIEGFFIEQIQLLMSNI